MGNGEITSLGRGLPSPSAFQFNVLKPCLQVHNISLQANLLLVDWMVVFQTHKQTHNISQGVNMNFMAEVFNVGP